MKITITFLFILVTGCGVFGQNKKPVRKGLKPTEKPKIYKAVVPAASPTTPAADVPKVYVYKLTGEYIYGSFVGGNGESITISITDGSTVSVKLNELSKIIFGDLGIATRISSSPERNPDSVSGGVLNGKAVSLPKPPYPASAAAVRASGAVNVQVTIDEKGDVISAAAISGHPLLRYEAEKAARLAKFSPTRLEGQPVQVTGIIVYHFVP